MDGTLRNKREINPCQVANFISKLTFFFTIPLFRKSWRNSINEDDIYEILEDFKSVTLGNRLEKEWDKESRKPNPRLIMCIAKMFGYQFLVLGIIFFVVNTTVLTVTPVLIGKIVALFSVNQIDKENSMVYPLWYGIGLICCIFIITLVTHSYMFNIMQLILKVKIACCSLIYRKCLKLNYVSLTEVTTGQAVTLMTKDVGIFDYGIYMVHQMWIGCVQTIIMTCVMYTYIGVSSLGGISMMALLIPLQIYLYKLTSTFRLKMATKTDNRIKITQEVLLAIRLIKMYTWDAFFSKSIATLRKKEVANLRILLYIKAIGLSIGQLNSRLAFYICIMFYVLLGNQVTAEKMFVITGCFSVMRVILTNMPLGITQMAELKASFQRISNFLLLEEVVDNRILSLDQNVSPCVSIQNLTVKADNGTIIEDVSMEIKQGLTVIAGPTGAGKSTLLKSIIQDIKCDKGLLDVVGKISYASQEPWLFPATIKQNIIFGEWYDQTRYDFVVEMCALQRDFAALQNGDKTCLTDSGLNLSGGQKMRINLARAIYRKADIYLLDDCLSAVDNRVGRQIFYECIKGFLKNSICIFVTHQVQFLKEADNIVVLDNGGVKFQGSFKEFGNLNLNLPLVDSNDILEYVDLNRMGDSEVGDINDIEVTTPLLKKPDNNVKNVYEEKKQEGSIDKFVYRTYFTSGGGIKILLIIVLLFILAQIMLSWSDYFIGLWVDKEQVLSSHMYNETVDTKENITLEEYHEGIVKQYSLIIFLTTIITLLQAFIFFTFTSKVSNNLHNSMIQKIINAGLTFFDENLSGNVINRFSKDLGHIDEQVPSTLFQCFRSALTTLSVLIVITSVNLLLLIPSILFICILVIVRKLYLPTGQNLRRLEGITRSPVIGHLNASLKGLTTIRASQAQKVLSREFDKHQDFFNSVVHMNLSTTRSFGFYLDALCGVYISIVIITFVLAKSENIAGKAGLAITQSLYLTGLLQWGVRQLADFENYMVSTERLLEYSKIIPENVSGKKMLEWPSNGKIAYEKVNLRYSSSRETVLKNVNFTIEPKHKVGIVGRTGAGKSSIVAILFRMYEFEGSIVIDDVDIKDVHINLLRSKISIIPQDPILFSGTIRSNLDPYGEYSDVDIWEALEEVEMKKVVESLNIQVCEGGTNYSVGQRQLLCLARAIIRRNIILVLDEATANIDPETDGVIQRTIRRKFLDCTVITIAHRLHTVMDSDKILVMDAGTVIEYDTPNALLENKSGAFYCMAKDGGLL